MVKPDIPFVEFPKMARLSREVLITEKIDGSNAQVYISEHGDVFAGSRSRWITPEEDNFGFARWVEENADELLKLGPGSHFGEWWGAGIQRRYNQSVKHFSLFNVDRWADDDVRPDCCLVVPLLYRGLFNTDAVQRALGDLFAHGSKAAPGFMNPEGVVVYHVAGRVGFKKTLEKDEQPKGQQG